MALAGDLNPPAGPVSATMKPLSEVEPRIAINATNTPGDADSVYQIDTPGSYYLTAEAVALPGKTAIEITAADVTVDLNGFRVGGYPGSLHGIKAGGSNRRNITVKNGIVRTMGGDGVNLRSDNDTVSKGCRLQDLTIQDCGGNGVYCDQITTVERVNCSNHSNNGMLLSGNSVVRSCTFVGNHTGAVILGAATISDCVAANNSLTGLGVGDGSIVENCAARNNGHSGFEFDGRGSFTHCTAAGNATWGITFVEMAVITGCSCTFNGRDGIRTAGSGSVIKNNTCGSNGSAVIDGAGIAVEGPDNRVEGNNCIGNDVGIRVTVAGNVITRNTCSGNTTSWSVVAGNACYVVSANTGAAINGNNGGASLGTTDPNANLTY
ncbi:MAG: hypothetical protein ACKVS9_04945 [Phycisphaerae bacterium]